MDCEKLLKELTSIPAVSGGEGGIRRLLLSFFPQGITDPAGNIIVKFGKPEMNFAKKIILIDAHMDEVGFCYEKEEIIPIGDIDMEAIDPETIERVGKRGHFARRFIKRGMKIKSPALDNRAGVASVILAEKLIERKDGLVIVFTAREETAQYGIRSIEKSFTPDLFICVDSAYAGKTMKGCAIPTLGKGPAIQSKGDGFEIETGWMKEIARREGIPVQDEFIIGNDGGTNLSAVRWNCRKAQINVPVKDQHRALSTCDLRDIIQTAQLIAAIVRSFQDSM